MKQKDKIKNSAIDDNTTDIRKSKRWKFFAILIFLFLGMLVVVARLFYIQVINYDHYKKIAYNQQQSRRQTTPRRGNIYDRNGKLLASSIKSVSIAVDPTILNKKDSLALLIERNIGISKENILNKINSAKGQYVSLCRRVAPDRVASIRKLNDRGIIISDEPIRNYNYSQIAGQIIGCTSIDNEGLSGIELQYDSLLRGKPGYMIMYRDSKQRLRPALSLPEIPTEDGADLHLTLDIELQKIVEFELMQGVVNSEATSGTIVALDPATGELLACASYPGYNPNISSTFNAESMRIRSVTDVYEPGSTFKAFTAACGLQEDIIKPTTVFNGHNGLYERPSFYIKDEHPLGMATFTEAFEWSSNIILSEVALKIPSHKFYSYIQYFGFGLKTGIDIPGELSGRIPKFELINTNTVDKRFLGFGYGALVTPIQLVAAYSGIANGGKLMRPYVVGKISKGNKTIKEIEPFFVRNVVSEKTAETLKDLLVGVVKNGTATRAYIKDLPIAGKTGTAQLLVSGEYSNRNHLASFIGYYPADNPKICMLVLVDKPKYNYFGGSVAAPIFRNVALRYASIAPEILNIDTNNTTNQSKKYVYVPELKGLTLENAKNVLSEIGLKAQSGDSQTGIVTSQVPQAGARVQRTSPILLQTKAIDFTENNFSGSSGDLSKTSPPNVRGLSIRRATTMLHSLGYNVNITGNGTVYSQVWKLNDKKEYICYLKCR